MNTAVVRDGSGARSAALPHFFLERYTVSYVRQWEAFAAAVAVGGPDRRRPAPTDGLLWWLG